MTDRMAVVVTCVDAPQLLQLCLNHLVGNTSPKTDIYVFDNGSTEALTTEHSRVTIVRVPENIGGNAVFHAMLPWLESRHCTIAAFIHCDMIVLEGNWDQRVVAAFQADPKLAVCGFAGSNQLDEHGGRGTGTVLNYAGLFYEGIGQATTAEQHGMRASEVRPAAVLDHCSMIFRLSDLKALPPQEGNYAPGHFLDRIYCAELLYRGRHVATIGVRCDHFNGGIAGGITKQLDLYRKWLTQEGLPFTEATLDRDLYVESERRFLTRYRQELQLIPCMVNPDYSITHFTYDGCSGSWVGTPYGTN